MSVFSNRITDPAFARYVKNANRWATSFALGLAAVAVVGFYVAGEMDGSEMDNPESLYVGLTIGGMFVAIAMVQVLGRKRSRTWDGQVVDKRVERKRRKRQRDHDNYVWEDYELFTVFVRSDSGRLYRIMAENDDTVWNYWAIGDRLRHHGGLNSYEKYDKSKDTIIFCNACASLHDIEEEYCHRCGCPLLK